MFTSRWDEWLEIENLKEFVKEDVQKQLVRGRSAMVKNPKPFRKNKTIKSAGLNYFKFHTCITYIRACWGLYTVMMTVLITIPVYTISWIRGRPTSTVLGKGCRWIELLLC